MEFTSKKEFCLTDLQNVNITLRILFRPQPQVLPNMYMNLGEDYDERVLPSITTEVLKAVVVGHNVLVYFNVQTTYVHFYHQVKFSGVVPTIPT